MGEDTHSSISTVPGFQGALPSTSRSRGGSLTSDTSSGAVSEVANPGAVSEVLPPIPGPVLPAVPEAMEEVVPPIPKDQPMPLDLCVLAASQAPAPEDPPTPLDLHDSYGGVSDDEAVSDRFWSWVEPLMPAQPPAMISQIIK